MAVTSDDLLTFIRDAALRSITLDADGNEVSRSEPVLEGEPLAAAIHHITDLAAHEEGLAFAVRQYEDKFAMGGTPANVMSFPGPRTN